MDTELFREYMGDSQVKGLGLITGGIDFILGKPGRRPKREFKQISRRGLAKAHALCAAADGGKSKSLGSWLF